MVSHVAKATQKDYKHYLMEELVDVDVHVEETSYVNVLVEVDLEQVLIHNGSCVVEIRVNDLKVLAAEVPCLRYAKPGILYPL